MSLIERVYRLLVDQLSTTVVVSLIRTGWIAAILPILVACIPSSKLTAYHKLLVKFAGRGKIMDPSSKKHSVPQKFFCHFYIVAVIWATFLLVATWLYAYKTTRIVSEPVVYSSVASHLTGVSDEIFLHKSHSPLREYKHGIWKSVFLLLLMEVQVVRRLIESIYVFKYSPSARMHIAGYLAGLLFLLEKKKEVMLSSSDHLSGNSFYTAAPLSLCCTFSLEVVKFVANLSAEFVVKGKDGMQVREFDLWGAVNPLMQLKWYTWIGAAFFFWGWIHQCRCHAILGSLRENNRKVDEYVIPHGDWFEYVSSPHYLAEIVIYGGVVIASGLSDITIWLPFVFVVANLTFAAVETHMWYLRKFDNYPRNRYAIIPFVY